MITTKTTLMSLLLATALAVPAASAEEIVGDPDKGAKKARVCTSCHTFAEGEADRAGPNLWGFFGKPAASKESYTSYSPNIRELSAEGLVWNDETLDAYLKNPKDVVPKGFMSFAGLAREKDRANVIAFLKEATGYEEEAGAMEEAEEPAEEPAAEPAEAGTEAEEAAE